jgi:predicted nucleic acid-binding protein
MYLVMDTSALLAVLLNEPARRALIRSTEGHDLVGAPTLPWEVGNALVAAFRRRRLSVSQVRQAWAS